MNINNIEELAKIMQQYQLASLEFTEGESTVRLESAHQTETVSKVSAYQPAPAQSIPDIKESNIDFNDLREIKSPMVGVFYTSSAPGVAPFVSVGSQIKKGDVLCIIEAMKLMNEISAETEGQIVDVCVANGDIVEFGQTLFKII